MPTQPQVIQDIPQLGIMPEKLWRGNRVDDLIQAISERRNSGGPPLAQWYEELRKHLQYLKEEIQTD